MASLPQMPYESRQMMPFAALLVSGVAWSIPKTSGRAIPVEVRTDPHQVVRLCILMATLLLFCSDTDSYITTGTP